MLREKQRRLFKWLGWFLGANALLSLCIQSTFFFYFPGFSSIADLTPLDPLLGGIFVVSAFIAHSIFICSLIAGIVSLLILIGPCRFYVLPVTTLFTIALISAEIIDRIAYSVFHTHHLGMIWTIFKTGALSQVITLSFSEIFLVFICVLLITISEFGFSFWLWRKLNTVKAPTIVKPLLIITGTTFFISYGLMAASVSLPLQFRLSEPRSHMILKLSQTVPYFSWVYQKILPSDGQAGRTVVSNHHLVHFQTEENIGALNYPHHPLVCHPQKAMPNIVFIVVDTWRYDSMTPTITPNIAAFKQYASDFTNHYSGGNCTQSGIFSLFYGIPANYWDAMLTAHQGPVLLKTLNEFNYQMAIYSSATLEFPEFTKTVFVDTPLLPTKTEGDNSLARDRRITDNFLFFLSHRDEKKPFFGFLFYDSAHNYCEGSEAFHQTPFQPAIKNCARFSLSQDTNRDLYLNRYHNALYYIDHHIGRVLDALKQSDLLSNTIVVITADHGTQFNDNHTGLWSHSSAYTPYQLHVPLLIHDPEKSNKIIAAHTSHMDIAPTLLHDNLSCSNPYSDYTTGVNLYSKEQPKTLLSASYSDYAIIHGKQVTRIYPNGDYVIQNMEGGDKKQGRLNPKVLQEASAELEQFYENKA